MTRASRFSLLIIAILSLPGCGDKQAAEAYGSLATSVMVANGTCISTTDCVNKKLVFSTAGFTGVAISVFDTNNPAAIAAIERNLKQHQTFQKAPPVFLTVYSSKYGEEKVKLYETTIE